MPTTQREILSQVEIERRAIVFAGLSALLTLAIAMLTIYFTATSSLGIRLLGDIVAISVAGVSVLGFVVGYRNSQSNFNPHNGYLSKIRKFVAIVALSFGHGSIGYLSVVAVSYVVANFSPQMTFEAPMAVLIISFAVALASYIVYLRSSNMSTHKLAGVLTVFTISGTFASMIMSENNYWWQNHFSALGTGGTLSSYAFNLTLIIGGALIASLADYIVSDIYKIYDHGNHYAKIKIRIVRVLFIFLGITMILVGAFPYDSYLFFHNIFANLMTSTLVLLMVSIPLLVPRFSVAFISFSYILVLAIAGGYWFCLDGKISLLVWEVIAAMIFFIWLIIFIRQISAICEDECIVSKKSLQVVDNNSAIEKV